MCSEASDCDIEGDTGEDTFQVSCSGVNGTVGSRSCSEESPAGSAFDGDSALSSSHRKENGKMHSSENEHGTKGALNSEYSCSSSAERGIDERGGSVQIKFDGFVGVCADEEGLKTYVSCMDVLQKWDGSTRHSYGLDLKQAEALIHAQTSEKRAMSARRSLLKKVEYANGSMIAQYVCTWLSFFPKPERLQGAWQDLHPILNRRRGAERRSLQEETLDEVRSWANLVCGSWTTSPFSWVAIPKDVIAAVTTFLLPPAGSLVIPLLHPSLWLKSSATTSQHFQCWRSIIAIKDDAELQNRVHSAREKVVVLGIIFHSWRLSSPSLDGDRPLSE